MEDSFRLFGGMEFNFSKNIVETYKVTLTSIYKTVNSENIVEYKDTCLVWSIRFW